MAMMPRDAVLLTGATGFLGRYLLRHLLARGQMVAVLARDSVRSSASHRIANIVASWRDQTGQELPLPTVLTGDLTKHALGLDEAARSWLERHCRAVIHAAADLSFRNTPHGEPWRTNLDGTKALVSICQAAGISEWHQISTAFVCGDRTGLIGEDELDRPASFHNPYEESKFEAECLLRDSSGIRATIYRPSIIVGDSRTGHTSSFNGIYRFLELTTRLASVHGDNGRLPIRLPLTGAEGWHLVPVDWVSRAVVELVALPRWHGRTFHLVSRSPISTRVVHDVTAEELELRGMEFVGANGPGDPTRLEELFLDGIKEYWPYLGGNPVFDDKNTSAALPQLPPPVIDREMLLRLIRFAVANRRDRGKPTARKSPDSVSRCADYIERIFPAQARRSELGRAVGLNIIVGMDVRGPGGGRWTCKWRAGELIYARRGRPEPAEVTYRTDTETFDAVVSRRQSPQQAFFEQRIEIEGDLETALKLAVLFGQFLAEWPPPVLHHKEVMHSHAPRT